jgi:hypothetical protein
MSDHCEKEDCHCQPIRDQRDKAEKERDEWKCCADSAEKQRAELKAGRDRVEKGLGAEISPATNHDLEWWGLRKRDLDLRISQMRFSLEMSIKQSALMDKFLKNKKMAEKGMSEEEFQKILSEPDEPEKS